VVHLRGVTSVETAAIEMEAAAALSKRCRDPVYHLIIAYAKNERPTREQVVSDAERLLKAIGDGEEPVRSGGAQGHRRLPPPMSSPTVSDRMARANDLWHERIKRERVCAEIAAERGWAIVVGHHNRDIVQRVEHLYAPPPDPQRRLSRRRVSAAARAWRAAVAREVRGPTCWIRWIAPRTGATCISACVRTVSW